MKPIAGSVVSSKPVLLSKAASILSRFLSASDTAVHQDASAFLRRTSQAFDELVSFHRDLQREGGSAASWEAEEEADTRKKKQKKKHKQAAAVEAAPAAAPQDGNDGSFAEIEGDRRRKKKKKIKEEEGAAVEADIGGGDHPGTSGRRRHGKGDALDLLLGEINNNDNIDGREKKMPARDILEVRIGGNVVEMKSENNNKTEATRPNKKEDVEVGKEGGVENHSERRRKKKRKKEEDVVEGGSGDGAENHVESLPLKKKRKTKRGDEQQS